MQFSSSTTLQIAINYKNSGNYVQAYKTVLNDLKANNPIPTAGDKDVMTWLQTAIEINSGSNTLAALAVRANNVAQHRIYMAISNQNQRLQS